MDRLVKFSEWIRRLHICTLLYCRVSLDTQVRSVHSTNMQSLYRVDYVEYAEYGFYYCTVYLS